MADKVPEIPVKQPIPIPGVQNNPAHNKQTTVPNKGGGANPVDKDNQEVSSPDDIRAVLKELASLRGEVASLRGTQAKIPLPPDMNNVPFVPSKIRELPAGASFRKVRVDLPYCKPLDMEVVCIPGMELNMRQQAIEQYNEHFNINSTQHSHNVTEIVE